MDVVSPGLRQRLLPLSLRPQPSSTKMTSAGTTHRHRDYGISTFLHPTRAGLAQRPLKPRLPGPGRSVLVGSASGPAGDNSVVGHSVRSGVGVGINNMLVLATSALGPARPLTLAATRVLRRAGPNALPLPPQVVSGHSRQLYEQRRSRDPQVGTATPVPADAAPSKSRSPFYFEAGYAGWAKRPSRPFPPPFFSPPSGSFSDPLSTHNRAADRRPKVNGQMIRGVTNGDDAMLVSDNLIGTNDGVGAWATKERGHAPLWSRLMVHFLAMTTEENEYGGANGLPDPVKYLDEAYARTKEALSEPNEWLGTTTSCSALLHFADDSGSSRPVLYVTQLGDCKCLVIRPRDKSVLFATEEQWHYFDCPRQLGTNSPDEPMVNAVLSKIELEENDMVLALSDGVTDNLWEGEITETVVDAMHAWEANRKGESGKDVGEGEGETYAEGMRFVAQELVLAARKIAEDPFAASPFMERAVDEGLAIEGGKLDDISVVAALCKRRKT